MFGSSLHYHALLECGEGRVEMSLHTVAYLQRSHLRGFIGCSCGSILGRLGVPVGHCDSDFFHCCKIMKQSNVQAGTLFCHARKSPRDAQACGAVGYPSSRSPSRCSSNREITTPHLVVRGPTGASFHPTSRPQETLRGATRLVQKPSGIWF